MLQFVEISETKNFKSKDENFKNNIHAAFIVYDITNEESFKSGKTWIELIKNFNKNCIFILVGNKKDLNDKKRVITEENVKELINSYHCFSIEMNCISESDENNDFLELFTIVLEAIEDSDNKKEIENQKIENQINEWKKLKRNDLFISISLIIILLSFNFYLIMKYINFENDEN